MSVPPGASTGAEDRPFALAVLAEVTRLVARPLWPGFDPRSLPLAVYDGRRTWLFRHPEPPPEFALSETLPQAAIYDGLHPSVRANTSVLLNGRRAATVMLDPARSRTLRESAALVIHELFHAFQRERHPDWTANEADLFVYPTGDAGPLALRRLETAALRRALAATPRHEQAGWAATAVALRRERFGRMPAEAAAYERGNELQEGLARYVDGKALGEDDVADSLAADFPADDIRSRTYAVGRALALLLDRLAPGWQRALEEGEARPLEALLGAALDAAGATPVAFAASEREGAAQHAAADVAALRDERSKRREGFLALPGWQLVITAAEDAPLWPQGFDPSNVQVLGPDGVLHTRWLRLGNAAGSMEVLGRQALTDAAGRHPLFTGVRQVTAAGLIAEPAVRAGADRVEIGADGVAATFRAAEVERTGRQLVVRLPGGRRPG